MKNSHRFAIAMPWLVAAVLVAAMPAARAQDPVEPKTAVSGASKSVKTRTLEAGAKLLQRHAPMHGFDIYLVGFHPVKEHPEMQMEARHYCHQVNEDFAQCVLFDGNTWQVWNTGMEGQAGDKLPMGDPMLAWSFNRDGEALPGMVGKRDKTMGIDSRQARGDRADLKSLAKPQSGVDDLKGKFGRPAQDIPGVVDSKAGATPR